MKLTGKAKARFESWYLSDSVPNTYPHIVNLYGLPDSLQWGVVQDWADSIGYRADVLSETVLEIGTLHGFTISKLQKKSVPHYPYTRTFYDKLDSVFGYVGYEEARNAAIEKLNEIINSSAV